MSNSDLTVQIKTTSDNAGVDKAKQGIQSIGEEARSSDSKSGGFVSTLNDMGKNLVSIGAAFVAYGIVQQVEDMGTAVFAAAGNLEQTNMSYQSLLGNVQQANSLFSTLTQYANTTPFTSLQINDAAKQLLAFGQTGDQVVSTVKQLGDVTSAGGGDLQALSLVTGQIFAQGKLRAQDMYQVINDGGAGLIHIMAENAGGMQKLTDEFNSGGIPAQQYFDAIKTATDKGGFAFQGAQKQAQTFNGMLSTLSDAATQFGEKLIGVHVDPQLGLVIDKGGLFDRAKGIIGGLTEAFQNLGDHSGPVIAGFMSFASAIKNDVMPYVNELIAKFRDDFGEVMKNDKGFLMDLVAVLKFELGTEIKIILSAIGLLADAIRVFLDTGQHLGDFFGTVAKDWNKAIGIIGKDVTGFFDDIGKWFHDANTNITNSGKALINSVVTSVTGAFNALVFFFINLPKEIGFALGLAIGVLDGFATRDVPNFVNTSIAWFKRLPTETGKAISDMWNGISTSFTQGGVETEKRTQSTVNNVIAWFQQLPGTLASIVSSLWGSVVGAFISFNNSANQWANDAVNNIVNTFKSLPDKIGKAVSGAWNSASSGIGKDWNSFISGLTSGFSSGKGFATGGYTGAGGVNEVAGVVHRGEYVLPQSAVNQRTGQPKAISSSAINVTNHIYNQVDYDKGIMQLGFMLRTR